MYYGFGFGLGCIIVWATLIKDRDRPAWMPEGRIIEFLEDTEVQINDAVKCKLECYSIPIDFMNTDFWASAKVNFKESATERKPCPEYKIYSKGIVVYIEVCDVEEKATLRNVETSDNKNCNCEL